ncbi:MAG: hypothetical protein JWP12_3507 [Bacteroidetes bacterium]|nr:hypothetical protein [Bacteroidota bacterium]
MKQICKIIVPVFAFIFIHSGQMKGQNPEQPQPTIWDIPHHTAWEKLMWIHRTVTFIVIKDRKPLVDTAYVKLYPKRFTVTVPVSARLMYFNLIDWQTNRRLQFSPNYRYDVGIGLSSRWATFVANTGITFYNAHKSERGVTKYSDLQLNLYGKRVTSDISYQNYHGFYVGNTPKYDYPGSAKYEIRGDVKATLFATSTYYIFNFKKFSYRSAFAFTEQQKKSAGSFLLGGYYTLFGMKADSSLVSTAFAPYFDPKSHIIEGSSQTFGLNAGYIYTFVKNKFYITTSIVPGIGLEQEHYERSDSSTYRSPFNPSGKLSLRLGFGYDHGNYFIGTNGMYDYFWAFDKSNATFNYSTGKFRVFIGYRFNFLKAEKRILRKLSLIDYPGDPRRKD